MFEKAIEEFKKNGFVLIPDFLDENTVNEMKDAIYKRVEAMDVEKEKLLTDSTENPEYMNYGDRITCLFEPTAFDENGKLKYDKHRALFRIGFALHTMDPTFKKVTFSDKVKTLVKELGFEKPRVCQGMYIFKNPEIGGLFIPHQDATYLHAVGEELREVGLWFPMEDATEENGTLFFIPGSHKTGLHRQFVREGDTDKYVFTNDIPKYDEKDFVPVIAPKGSAVLIDGLVVHKSAQNKSQKPRPVYTIHLYDDKTCQWDSRNWLQPNAINPFPALYA